MRLAGGFLSGSEIAFRGLGQRAPFIDLGACSVVLPSLVPRGRFLHIVISARTQIVEHPRETIRQRRESAPTGTPEPSGGAEPRLARRDREAAPGGANPGYVVTIRTAPTAVGARARRRRCAPGARSFVPVRSAPRL